MITGVTLRRVAPLLAVAVASVVPSRLPAQCPDGTPPPCRVRAARPRLDERTWIVLPFENVARAADIDWLREASVNLLYLDLSRWQDIRVIDDERVADLIRGLPSATRDRPGLDAGLAVARRAGAGKLVMGDLLLEGARTTIVAKVFDARTGQRVRTVTERTSGTDSLSAVFSRLARGILSVPPPPGASLGAVGTTSVDAYREYLAGVSALSSWSLDTAEAHFRSAIARDSTFALAHYKLSVVLGWREGSSPGRRRYAEAAQRLAGTLPARERALIAGQFAQAQGRWAEGCETYTALLRADSADVEAWYNLGECSFHDPAVLTDPSDTTRARFRSSWNTSLRAMIRALDLDPSYHLAFQHIQDILQNERRDGCRERSPGTCGEAYAAVVERDGDTLVTRPLPLRQFFEVAALPVPLRRREARRANLVLARDIAARWVTSAPQEPRAHLAYGLTLLATGDAQGAAREFAAAGGDAQSVTRAQALPGSGGATLMAARFEMLLKLDSVVAARRLADSMLALGLAAPSASSLARIFEVTLFGRPRLFFQMIPAGLPIARYVVAIAQLGAGVMPDSLEAIEAAFRSFATGPGPAAMGLPISPELLLASSMLAFPMRRSSVAIDTAFSDPRMRLLAAATSVDTGRARRAVQALDSTLASLPTDAPDDGAVFFSAEVHLVLGDSTVALQRLLDFERRWSFISIRTSINPGGFDPVIFIWGRASMLLGDLALALNRREDAIRAYRRVVALWTDAEPEIQPFVTRARAALARLGAN